MVTDKKGKVRMRRKRRKTLKEEVVQLEESGEEVCECGRRNYRTGREKRTRLKKDTDISSLGRESSKKNTYSDTETVQVCSLTSMNGRSKTVPHVLGESVPTNDEQTSLHCSDKTPSSFSKKKRTSSVPGSLTAEECDGPRQTDTLERRKNRMEGRWTDEGIRWVQWAAETSGRRVRRTDGGGRDKVDMCPRAEEREGRIHPDPLSFSTVTFVSRPSPSQVEVSVTP